MARELGIPAVIGCRGAMELIGDGDVIDVDAAAGEVRVVSRVRDADGHDLTLDTVERDVLEAPDEPVLAVLADRRLDGHLPHVADPPASAPTRRRGRWPRTPPTAAFAAAGSPRWKSRVDTVNDTVVTEPARTSSGRFWVSSAISTTPATSATATSDGRARRASSPRSPQQGERILTAVEQAAGRRCSSAPRRWARPRSAARPAVARETPLDDPRQRRQHGAGAEQDGDEHRRAVGAGQPGERHARRRRGVAEDLQPALLGLRADARRGAARRGGCGR